MSPASRFLCRFVDWLEAEPCDEAETVEPSFFRFFSEEAELRRLVRSRSEYVFPCEYKIRSSRLDARGVAPLTVLLAGDAVE